MKKLQIHSYDSVWTVCDQPTAVLLNREFSFEVEYWISTYRGKKKVKSRKYLIEARNKGEHFFHTGLVPRALKYLKSEGKKVNYTSDIKPVEYDGPYIPGIKFRKFQKEAFKNVLSNGRGVIKAPTGTGKTIVIAGLVSCFSSENILILIHTTDLINQTIEELNGFGLHCTEYSGKKKQISRITVATIQSFKNVVKEYADYYDVVVVDETHHASSLTGSYAKVLSQLTAPVKLGTTATLPYKEEAKWSLESLIGPVISEYKIAEAQVDRILAKPEIVVYKTPRVDSRILDSSTGINNRKDGTEPTKYVRHYHNGVVWNTSRNFLIAEIAKKYIKEKKTVLISVVNVVHGRNISKLIKGCVFVHGATSKEDREEIKEKFIKKEIKCVVATVVWQEGLNIPSLDVCVLAGSGKSDIKVVQGIGRGLRKTKGKDKVIIIDFDDSDISKYLKNHYEMRNKIYKKMNWI